MSAARQFVDAPAVRENAQLLLGIIGPSGGGKTFSALRIATGIQRVVGGDIFFVDTESRRALHYADKFRFRHVPFGSPFSPDDYLQVMQHCIRRGAKTIIVDSMSHEHEGPGGVLEMWEAELQRMAGDDYDKRNRVQGFAWGPPKRARRRLINAMTTEWGGVHLIFCFRAKEKLDWNNKNEKGQPTELGWLPIAGDEFVYELTFRALLPPGADGVAQWQPKQQGSKDMVKLPEQFRWLIEKPRKFDEAMGEEMARWAAGDVKPAARAAAPLFRSKLAWQGAEEWASKPLADAPREALELYREAAKAAGEGTTGKAAQAIAAHLAEVDAAIAAKPQEAAPAPAQDDPRVAAFMSAAGCDEARARELIAQGREIDVQTGEVVPPPGAEG